MSNPLIPVYPKGVMPDEAPPPAQEAQAAASARSRTQVLANLSQDVDFRAHILDGFLKQQEEEALNLLENCDAASAAEKREAWRTLKHLRQRLRDEIEAARQHMQKPNTAAAPPAS